jgi:hypothetical protein
MLYAMAGLGLVLLYRYLAALYRARVATGRNAETGDANDAAGERVSRLQWTEES